MNISVGNTISLVPQNVFGKDTLGAAIQRKKITEINVSRRNGHKRILIKTVDVNSLKVFRTLFSNGRLAKVWDDNNKYNVIGIE